jgi:hypothetical protein
MCEIWTYGIMWFVVHVWFLMIDIGDVLCLFHQCDMWIWFGDYAYMCSLEKTCEYVIMMVYVHIWIIVLESLMIESLEFLLRNWTCRIYLEMLFTWFMWSVLNSYECWLYRCTWLYYFIIMWILTLLLEWCSFRDIAQVLEREVAVRCTWKVKKHSCFFSFAR